MEDRSLKKIKKPLPDSVYLLLLVFQWSCYSKSFNLPLLKQIQGSSILSLSASKCLQNHDFSKETTISPSSEWTQKDSTLRSHWFYNNICRFKTAWSITHHMDDLEEVSNLLTAGISLSLSLFLCLFFPPPSFSPNLLFLFYEFENLDGCCWAEIPASMNTLIKTQLCYQNIDFITLYWCWNLIFF